MSETIARAWAVTRADGLVLGFTDHDQVLSFDGILFRPDSGLTARAVVQSSGLSVDNSEAVGVLSDNAITEIDLMAGRWDGADVRLWDVDWTAPDNRRLIFRGHLGEIARSGAAFRAELRGLSEPLNKSQGRVYHPRCSAELGDGQCRFDLTKAGYSAEGVIQSEDGGQRLILTGIAGHDTHWFEHGQVLVLTGPAEGLSGVIKVDQAQANARRQIELWTGLGIRPQIGDRLRLIAGCDKRSETCRMKFLNYLNFRGFPHLPPEDWLIAPKVNR